MPPPAPRDGVAAAIRETLISVNESDSNLEPANVVDAIVKAGRIVAASNEKIAEAINRLCEILIEKEGLPG